jgi:ribosome-binding factor A
MKGVDPDFAAAPLSEDSSEKSSNRKNDFKTLQLCAQVRDALGLAITGECHDDVLRELCVDTVEPAPNASRLLVRLIVPKHANVDVSDLYERLAKVGPFLRTLVAKEISRKRTPELMFIAMPESEVQR